VEVEKPAFTKLENFRSTYNTWHINKLHMFFINVFLAVNPENIADTRILILMQDGELYQIKIKQPDKLLYGIKDAEWFCAYLQRTQSDIKFRDEVYKFEGGCQTSDLNTDCYVSHSPIDTSRPARYAKLQKSSGVFRYVEDKNLGFINIFQKPKYLQRYQSCLITK
jgi:hypothetical protein